MAGNVGLGDDRSIPKLMDFLKTAFLPSHFDDVQEILINREEKLKVEIERSKEKLKVEIDRSKEKLKVEIERSMEKLKVEIERLKEENDGLRLDKIALETENEKLNHRIFLVNKDTMALPVRERRLLEEMQNGRVFGEPPVVNNIKAGLSANGTVPENGNGELPRMKVETDVSNCNDTVPKNGDSSFAGGRIEVDESGLNGHTCPVGAQTRPTLEEDFDNSHEAGSKGHEDRVCIVISDSGSDSDLGTILPEKSVQTSQSKRITKESGSATLKRKQESEAKNRCTDDNTQPSKRVHLQEQMEAKRTSLSNMSKVFLDTVGEPYNQQTPNNTSAGEADPTQNPTAKRNEEMNYLLRLCAAGKKAGNAGIEFTRMIREEHEKFGHSECSGRISDRSLVEAVNEFTRLIREGHESEWSGHICSMYNYLVVNNVEEKYKLLFERCTVALTRLERLKEQMT